MLISGFGLKNSTLSYFANDTKRSCSITCSEMSSGMMERGSCGSRFSGSHTPGFSESLAESEDSKNLCGTLCHNPPRSWHMQASAFSAALCSEERRHQCLSLI
jgi:hypothetical protein